MKAAMLGLLAETPVHPGSGRSTGVVDLPVAREAATDYPVLVGSGLKGALRDKTERMGGDGARHFGEINKAGDLLVSDGRLLLLPVRSLTGRYRWATCPHMIERFSRDLCRVGLATTATPKTDCGKVLTAGEGKLFLEEREFDISGPLPEGLTAAIAPLLLHQETRERLAAQVAILHDDDFAWFARYGLAIQARNVLEDDTKKSRNLWYEETLPPDTVMYALVAARGGTGPGAALNGLFPDDDPYLQAGGNETVGQGRFAVRVVLHSGGEESAP